MKKKELPRKSRGHEESNQGMLLNALGGMWGAFHWASRLKSQVEKRETTTLENNNSTQKKKIITKFNCSLSATAHLCLPLFCTNWLGCVSQPAHPFLKDFPVIYSLLICSSFTSLSNSRQLLLIWSDWSTHWLGKGKLPKMKCHTLP